MKKTEKVDLKPEIEKEEKELKTIDEYEDDDTDDEEIQRRMTIAEAFANDDVVEEFAKKKEEVVDSETLKAVDLGMPGWGTWGGEGLGKKSIM